VTSPVGCTRTLPVGAVSEFKMAVASCSNYPQGFFHAYRDIAESELDVVLHLGDYLYEYPVGDYANPVAENQFGRTVEARARNSGARGLPHASRAIPHRPRLYKPPTRRTRGSRCGMTTR
jgi:phosphodiesterase/alkaline phosphatase D-like protein